LNPFILEVAIGGLALALLLVGVLLVARRRRRAHGAHEHQPFRLTAELHPMVRRDDKRRSEMPGVIIRLRGANVWIHEMRLSWGPNILTGWTVDRAYLRPWADSTVLPALIHDRDELRFEWPGDDPEDRVGLRCALEAFYSLARESAVESMTFEPQRIEWQPTK
jgi:hypothetical protein